MIARMRETVVSLPRRSRLRRLCVALAVVYLVALLVLVLLEDRFVYHNRNHRIRADQSIEHELNAELIWLRTVDGTAIRALWCPCGDSQDAVLFCHGNTGSVGSQGPVVRRIRDQLKSAVLVFDYPGFGESDGAPTETGCYAAGEAAFDWLASRRSATRIVILGQSLGGGVAVDLAGRHPHRALALFKTFTSIADVAQSKLPIFPCRWLVRNRFDSFRKIGHCQAPVFISHGDSDHLIPLEQAWRLFSAAQEPKRLLVLEGVGHHGAIPPQFLDELSGFLREAPGDLGRSFLLLQPTGQMRYPPEKG